ncbi:hypothetical protein GRI38_00950 [Altererythrobacter aurantiacus]|uniref:Porin n=1 Tax=Parapontixanthobacter aurantiacus TaxID=1463599 RepID=A0A844ZCF6_9SPHN|nr:TorF family putative porin [Parapontixanthobacter aurantiacus]MXO84600.1 hypothetical protein [Parapontixanthobacter aurantiacus]
MLTSYRGLAAKSLVYAALFSAAAGATSVSAQTTLPPEEVDEGVEIEGPLTFSANVALTSEYRFRGVDLSGGEIAIQGGFDMAHESGFYVGTWASSLDETTVGFGSTEVDVYGGWGGNLTDAVSVDVGVIGYLYPDAGPGDFDYIEFYGSGSFAVGPASATVGVAYAPEQDSLGGTDNLYLYTDVGTGIPGTPVTLTGHLGYTDGFLTFTDDAEAFDWAITAEAGLYGPIGISVAYVGAEGDIPVGDYDYVDDAIVVTLSASF